MWLSPLVSWFFSGQVCNNNLISPSQETPPCSPVASGCLGKLNAQAFDCIVPCAGLYADVEFVSDSPKNSSQLMDEQDGAKLFRIISKYEDYKKSFAANIVFSNDHPPYFSEYV